MSALICELIDGIKATTSDRCLVRSAMQGSVGLTFAVPQFVGMAQYRIVPSESVFLPALTRPLPVSAFPCQIWACVGVPPPSQMAPEQRSNDGVPRLVTPDALRVFFGTTITWR